MLGLCRGWALCRPRGRCLESEGLLMNMVAACLLSALLAASPLLAQDAASPGSVPYGAGTVPTVITNAPSPPSGPSLQDFLALTNGLSPTQLSALLQMAAQPWNLAPSQLQALTSGLSSDELAALQALVAQPLGAQQQMPLSNSVVVS